MSSSPYNPIGPAHYAPPIQEPMRELRVAVVFATREGQTRRIAERVGADLRRLGFDVDTHDVRHPFPFDLCLYDAAVLAASVHAGTYEKEMVRFVKAHRGELSRIPTALLSVTLSEAGAQRTDASPSEHAQFVADVDEMSHKFIEQTQWSPNYTKPVAGALRYSKYNFLVRFIMKKIARKAGAATDTSRDYEYTDWADLDKFVEEFAPEIRDALSPADASQSAIREMEASHV